MTFARAFTALILTLVASQSVFADKTEFRRLNCMAAISDGKSTEVLTKEIHIPEDAFNYTRGMQTFWIPLSMAYVNGQAREITFTVALDKVGKSSGISYVNVSHESLESRRRTQIFETSRPQNSREWKGRFHGTAMTYDMACTLNPSKSY